MLGRIKNQRLCYNLPRVIGGDFNIVRFSKERLGETNIGERALFNELISQTKLMEILLYDRQYIWSNMRDNPSLARLDRVFVLQEWEERYPLASIASLARPTSDHVPIYLSSGELTQPIKSQFCFERWWLKHTEVWDQIRESWTQPTSAQDAACVIYYKLRRLRKVLTR